MTKKQSDIPHREAPPIKVGNIKKYIDNGKRKRVPIYYTYKDVAWSLDGWADSKKYLPSDFDLIYMRLKREKIIVGWISGSSWCGLRLKKGDEVLFWKIKKEDS